MRPETLFLLLIFVACPLMMVFMMRGGGHGNHGKQGMHSEESGGAGKASPDRIASIDELRSRRETLDAEIASREAAKETSPELPIGA